MCHHSLNQQDSASPHWGFEICQFFNETFPDRLIGYDGPIPWLPRFPDITPLNFFLWGYVKDIVYQTKVRDNNLLTVVELYIDIPKIMQNLQCIYI